MQRGAKKEEDTRKFLRFMVKTLSHFNKKNTCGKRQQELQARLSEIPHLRQIFIVSILRDCPTAFALSKKAAAMVVCFQRIQPPLGADVNAWTFQGKRPLYRSQMAEICMHIDYSNDILFLEDEHNGC